MTATEVPLLTTERLVLRAFHADDLESYAAMQANSEVMLYLGTGQTRSRGETWDAIVRMLGH